MLRVSRGSWGVLSLGGAGGPGGVGAAPLLCHMGSARNWRRAFILPSPLHAGSSCCAEGCFQKYQCFPFFSGRADFKEIFSSAASQWGISYGKGSSPALCVRRRAVGSTGRIHACGILACRPCLGPCPGLCPQGCVVHVGQWGGQQLTLVGSSEILCEF